MHGKLASLKSDKIGYVEKIVMLDLGVRKLRGDLRASVLKNIDFQAPT